MNLNSSTEYNFLIQKYSIVNKLLNFFSSRTCNLVNSPKAEVSTSSTTSSSQINKSNKSRLPISILPEDPEEKRKHIIGLVLERFPYLSLVDSDERADSFSLNSSTLCPLCNGDHKEERIWNDIRGEWGAGEYCSERTYRLECRNVYCGIPIVSVKA